MSGGSVKELGCHEELMKKKGLYAELVRRQTIESNSTL
jgi:ABC-type multidrug transport system fused ATPase/permease subunit